MERIAVYAGSFDPVTVGHLDIIRRAAPLFDRLIVLVGHNPEKKGCFPVDQRMELIRRCISDMENVEVDSWQGLTTEYARKAGACAMIRGLRSIGDFMAEDDLAQINARIAPGIETVFLLTAPEHRMVSSSAVREMAHYGASLDGFVPECIMGDVQARFSQEGSHRVLL